jgi:iron complex transport system ATP-binding protein
VTAAPPAAVGPVAPLGPLAGAAPAAELEDVSVAYRGRDVLHGISLAIGRGQRVALVGPNGAGKSTLLRALSGVVPVRSGRVMLEGRPVQGMSRATIARLVSAVPAATLPFAMRVEEVVALGRLPHEDPIRGLRAGDRAAIGAAIERVGLGGLVGRDVRELSLGERQLVLLAVAVAQEAPTMLLDEPTIHLDLRHQVEAMELLVDLNERDGTTICAVLHDLGLAAHFFPRVVVLERGSIVADGAPAETLTPTLIREVFGVDPALVRLEAKPG